MLERTRLFLVKLLRHEHHSNVANSINNKEQQRYDKNMLMVQEES